jgi:methylated-DNA-[protein]-cysteine S-methyltransferase
MDESMTTNNLRMYYTRMLTPIGELTIAGESEVLRFIYFPTGKMTARPEPHWEEAERGVVRETVQQLDAYFARKLRAFDLPLGPQGTDFQKEVWRELERIAYGETISYGELARRIGNPAASRAVGLANGRNPIPIVIPCHRVIGSNGKLTGFGGGLPVKESLLALEARQAVLTELPRRRADPASRADQADWRPVRWN